MNIRNIVVDDIDRVHKFWKDNYKVSERDTIERITDFICKNYDLSTLAEEDGDIVGTVLGSYDGRKGYIYKVVVRKDYRGIRVGEKLVKKTVNKILDRGALDMRVNCSEELVGFYKKSGFKAKGGIISLQIKRY